MTLVSVADITGDDAVHQIANVAGAKAILLSMKGTSSSLARIGDSSVSSTRGVQLLGQLGPLVLQINGADLNETYVPSSIFAYVASAGSGVLTISYVI